MGICAIRNVGKHARELIGHSIRTRHSGPGPSLVTGDQYPPCASFRRAGHQATRDRVRSGWKSHRSRRRTIAGDTQDRNHLETWTPHLPGCRREC